MKNNKSNKMKVIFSLIVIFQISLLINMTTANSYIISQTNTLRDSKKIDEKNNNLINSGINFLISFLSIKQIGVISAESVEWNCCPETKEGAICQNIASTDKESCAVAQIATSCDYVSDCKRGCCIDEEEGLCTTKTTKQKCEGEGGEWKDEENCLIAECQKGCCVLGNNAEFVTEKRCSLLSLFYGFEKDFRGYKSEVECLALSVSQEKGACVLDGGNCKFSAETECLNLGGDFYKDNLCSNPILNTICEKQKSTGCVEGKNEIYWFDSCGNRENIYSSDKDFSWNNGKILSKEESCNSKVSNAGSTTCGNCDGFESRCSETKAGETHVKDGNYICKSMNCIDENGIKRKNGESWCAYDGSIGEVTGPSGELISSDTVGSRHWKRYCIEGEINVEPCADYRGEICVQSEIKEDSKTFSIASCVMNEATFCLGYNEKEDMEELCNDNEYCVLKNVNIDKYFNFNVCVGKYPKGFDLNDNSGSNNAVCSMASQKCEVVYQKNHLGHWKCKANCDCEDKEFTEKMNDLCVSLGDCGSYINYVGDGTDNIKVSRAPKISWKEYKKYASIIKKKFASPQNLENLLIYTTGESKEVSFDDESGLQSTVDFLGTVSGGLGTIAYFTTPYFPGAVTALGKSAGMSSLGMSASVSAFASAAACAAIGAYVGSWLASHFGRSGTAATVLTMAGAAAGAFMALQYAGYLVKLGPYGWIAALVVIAFVLISGWGKTKTRIVEFTCMPWQAPVGGDNCEKCNGDDLKPCTEYRCSSLGQACELLNENEENPTCQSIAYEPNPPVISPKEILTEGYDFFNQESKKVEIRQEDKSCIPEWTPVLFIMETDEYAQCKFDFERKKDYEEMEEYSLEQTVYTKNHTLGFSMPSLDSLEVYNVTGDLEEKFGNLNMYIRCQDYHGNFNIEEYVVNFCINSGPDITPAYITKHIPEDGSCLKYGTDETNITIYLNEPAECKYDFVEGKNYEDMTNSMSCKTELTEVGAYGWACNTALKNSGDDENKIYIKCKDKPWVLTEEDIKKYKERNVNSEDFIYTLYNSESELKIDSISPKGIIEFGFEPVSVELEVKTSGGAENGESVCYWGNNFETLFFETNSNYHKQPLTNRMGGKYNIPIKCEDSAGNNDYENISFILEIDSSPPIATRIYREGDYMKIITNEEAECYYDFNKCYFNTENSTSMTIGFSKEHSAEWIVGKTYHIKCKDVWGNSNIDCMIKVSPSFFIQ
jgi:hypothetical protein